MSVNSSTYKSFSKRNACILLTQPRLCSCILLQKIYLRCAQERRCCPPNPSHLRRPRTGNTASSAGQEADIYPREGKIKDSMKPCLSPHKKNPLPTTSQWEEDFSTDITSVRMRSFPVSLHVTKGIWNRTELSPSPKFPIPLPLLLAQGCS